MKDFLTIILCVRNGLNTIPGLFNILGMQKNIPPLEIIVADTESTDGSLEYLTNLTNRTNWSNRIKVFKIKSRDFGHGKTRNSLMKMAKGNTVVFISQDIMPIGKYWLCHLIAPLKQKGVAASFGRQIPFNHAKLYDRFFYQESYPSKNREFNLKDLKFGPSSVYYSMVNACARRSFLLKYPFVTNKDASVDQWWAKEVLEKGFKIAYRRDAAVYHSHNYSYKELFKRQVLSGQSLIGFPRPNFMSLIFSLFGYLLKETVFIRKFGSASWRISEMGIMIIYESVRIFGFAWGSLSGRFR